MKKNVNKTDSYIRYALGVLFIVAAIIWTYWLLIPAAIALVTAYFKFCPLYKIFGISTVKKEKKE